YPGGVHGRDHGFSLSAIRAHNSLLGDHLGLQCTDAQPSLGGAPAAAPPNRTVARTARALFCLVQRRILARTEGLCSRLGFAYPALRACPRGADRIHDACGGNWARAASLISARRGPGLFHNQRATTGSRIAPANRRVDEKNRCHTEE